MLPLQKVPLGLRTPQVAPLHQSDAHSTSSEHGWPAPARHAYDAPERPHASTGVLQLLEQSPQLVLVARLTSQPSLRLSPSQSPYGKAQVPTQVALAHVRVHMWLAEHAAPHEPQLSWSLPRSTQAPEFGQQVAFDPPPQGPLGEVVLHVTHLLTLHTWLGPGQSGTGSVSHAQVPPEHALPDAHGEQLAVGLSHCLPNEPHVHVPERQVVPVPQMALHALQLFSSVARSVQLEPQHVLPVLQVWLWLPAPPQATQWKFTHVSDAFGHDSGPRHVHWPLSQVPPGPQPEQPAVPAAHALPLVPQVHLPATQVWPLAQLVPHAPQLNSSSAVVRQLDPQHVVPDLHVLPPLPGSPQLSQKPPTHTSFAFGQSVEVVQAQAPLLHALPAAQGEQASVPAVHVSLSAPHSHWPASQVVPVPQVVPQPPQLVALVCLSTQLDPQQESPSAQLKPPVPAAPHAWQLPATHTSESPGQSADTVQPQRLLVQVLPGAHGVQFNVPAAHDSASGPHLHSPAAHDSPDAQVVPQPPQFAVLVPMFVQVEPQQVAPDLQMPLPVPPPPQATHWPATHTSLAPAQSADTLHVHLPPRHSWPTAHGEHPAVPAPHILVSAPQVHLEATQVSPAAQVVPQPPQSDSLVVRSAQSPPQQVRPLAQNAPCVLAAPHAWHWPLTHTSPSPGQSPDVAHAHLAPPTHEKPGAHTLQSSVPGEQVIESLPHAHPLPSQL